MSAASPITVGRWAYQEGLELEDNPYRTEADARLFVAGWRRAQEQRIAAMRREREAVLA